MDIFKKKLIWGFALFISLVVIACFVNLKRVEGAYYSKMNTNLVEGARGYFYLDEGVVYSVSGIVGRIDAQIVGTYEGSDGIYLIKLDHDGSTTVIYPNAFSLGWPEYWQWQRGEPRNFWDLKRVLRPSVNRDVREAVEKSKKIK